MYESTVVEIPFVEVERPPTEDELPSDDGIPMETWRHRLQMNLLIETLDIAWADRDVFVGGDMFVYFSPNQVRDYDFRGPDFFVVLDVPRRERKSWVVWEEGKSPDLIIELLSKSTAQKDKGEKMSIYQDRLRVPEYWWFDPFSYDLAGFTLQEGIYQPIKRDAQGRFISKQLGLVLAQRPGKYYGVETHWLRWETLDGELLPTEREMRIQAQKHADEAKQRADELAHLLAQYRERFGDLPE